MSLPNSETAFLSSLGIDHQIIAENGMTCVLLQDWSLPAGLNLVSADLLVRLPPGYPDVCPDMWWFSPSVHRADGTDLPNTGVYEHHLGRRWQRWSRHLTPEQWRSGIDGLENYVALIRHDLERWVPAAVR